MYYQLQIAGYPIYYSFREEKTSAYFGNEIAASEETDSETVTIPESLVRQYSAKNNCGNDYAEYMSALYMASNTLLKYDCCCFHSVAIRVNGAGYLISASSGVGKSTQYMNLNELYPDQIEIINGDKPFLQFMDNGKIIIHPSPWRGKEDYGSDITCELKGIIFLRQADHNKIRRVSPDQVVVMSLSKFLCYPDNEKTVRKICDLDRKLLDIMPIWLFDNTGDLSSSQLLYESVLSGGAQL